MLFVAWPGMEARVTRDLDFLGLGAPYPDDVARRVARIAATPVPVDDGLVFDSASVVAHPIRPNSEHGGVRARLTARLGNARIPLQVDVVFGDAMVPGPADIAFPVLLDHPAPRILGYPVATVVAEKVEAMVSLGLVNTRFKDHYDLWMLARRLDLNNEPLAEAIAATFRRRGTPLGVPEPPGLAPGFFADEGRQGSWRSFVKRSRLMDAPEHFTEVGAVIRALAIPALRAAGATGQPGAPLDREER